MAEYSEQNRLELWPKSILTSFWVHLSRKIYSQLDVTSNQEVRDNNIKNNNYNGSEHKIRIIS